MSYPKTRLTRPIRRAIMVCFIVLFFIITPLILFYTAGYRYDFTAKEIKQTGVISLDVLPHDAQIFLNTVFIDKRMPLRLANRAPGTYHLRITKPGFEPWEKDITVESKKTTYIKNVSLFRTDESTVFFTDNSIISATAIYSSHTGDYILAVLPEDSMYTIYLIHTKTKKKIVIKKTIGTEAPKIIWSPWYDTALFINQTTNTDKIPPRTLELLDPAEEQIIATTELNTEAPLFHWNKNTPGVFIEKNTEKGREIVRLDKNGAQTISTLPDVAGAWYADGETNLWTFIPGNRTIRNEQSKEIISTNGSIVNSFIDVNENRIIAETGNDLAIFKIKNDGAQYLSTSRTRWNANTGELLTWSSSELWSIYQNGDAVLLDRRQEEITDVHPLDAYGVLLIATKTTLYGFNPGYAVTQILRTANEVEGIGVNERQKKIFFLGTVLGKRDLYTFPY